MIAIYYCQFQVHLYIQSKLVQSGDWDVPNVLNVRSQDISDQISTGNVPKCPHSERLGRSERSNRPIGQFRPVQMNLKLAIMNAIVPNDIPAITTQTDAKLCIV